MRWAFFAFVCCLIFSYCHKELQLEVLKLQQSPNNFEIQHFFDLHYYSQNNPFLVVGSNLTAASPTLRSLINLLKLENQQLQFADTVLLKYGFIGWDQSEEWILSAQHRAFSFPVGFIDQDQLSAILIAETINGSVHYNFLAKEQLEVKLSKLESNNLNYFDIQSQLNTIYRYEERLFGR